jgi:hypothetical protein
MVSGMDYMVHAALNEDGTFGTYAGVATNTAALESLLYMGAQVDWSQVIHSDNGGNGNGNGGNGDGEPSSGVISVFLEITGPSSRVLYERNTVNISANDPNLVEALKQSGLSYNLKDGNFVNEIGGHANSGLNGWMYKVNGKSLTATATNYQLKEGDSLLWFYSEDPSNIAGVGNGSGDGGGEPAAVVTPTSTPAPSPSPTPAAAASQTEYKTQIVIKIDETEARVDGEARSLDVSSRIIEGRTMAPLRFVSEAMGAKISWLEASKEVVIERGQASEAAAQPETRANAAAQRILQSYQGSDQLSLWEGMALTSQGISAPQGVTEDLLEEISREQGEYRMATDYAKAILYLKSVGQDPKNVGGYNLVEKLCNLNDLDRQGANGLIWALNALESETAPTGAVWTRERLMETLLTYQNQDGGFSLAQGGDSDVDVTAMALATLSDQDREDASRAASRALEYLTRSQLEDGEFLGMDVKNSSSLSQVVLALCKLGADPLDARFVKQGKTLIDLLLSYQAEDGRFKHEHEGQASDMATEQAVQALIQYGKFAAEQRGPRIVLKVRAYSPNPDMAPVIVDGRVLVPVRYVTEKLGAEVQWDQTARTVTILKR